MARLREAQPGSIARPPLEAEFERRNFVAVLDEVIAGLGLLVGTEHHRRGGAAGAHSGP
jgi:hypothetical protein